MKRSATDEPCGAVLDVPIAAPVPYPYLSITLAKFIVSRLGVGGHCYIRSPYVLTFFYAARALDCAIQTRQCFRNGVAMHRLTRTG